MTRRSFIGVGAAAMAATALAGCSSGSGSGSASASASSASASAASASAASASASASASAASASAAGTGSALRFATGGESGTYYALGTIMAQHANNNAGLNITAVSSDGSKANVLDIEDGVAQLAFCQSDVASYAYNGSTFEDFEGMPIKKLTTVAALYEEQIQIVTCDPSIKSVADLKGKNVSIGAAGSGVYFNAIDVLGVYDITESDISAKYQSFQDSADALKDGKIDAAFVVAGAPTSAITDLATTKDAYLVEIDAEHAQALKSKNSFYNEAKIPANTYTGTANAETATVSVDSLVLAVDSVSEDDVYAFVADIFDNLPELEESNAKFSEFDVKKAASYDVVPYHPGAAKYFKEKGATVAGA
ncbi:MAG TPA: C4-dicarboxylate ABC transporter substrate-binding protein [Eggerthellaceae bacterium]|nr:C4-dicarboxylate ABC transporter substrate-binding protein [Eggerthellaceae bacterium]